MHSPLRADGATGTDRHPELGFIRYAPCGLPAGAPEPGRDRDRIRLGLPGVLPMVVHRPRGLRARLAQAPGQALRVRGWLEEVRGRVESRDSSASAPLHDADPRRGAL